MSALPSCLKLWRVRTAKSTWDVSVAVSYRILFSTLRAAMGSQSESTFLKHDSLMILLAPCAMNTISKNWDPCYKTVPAGLEHLEHPCGAMSRRPSTHKALRTDQSLRWCSITKDSKSGCANFSASKSRKWANAKVLKAPDRRIHCGTEICKQNTE